VSCRRRNQTAVIDGPTGRHHLRPAASLPGKPVAGPRWAPACAGVTNKGAASERSEAKRCNAPNHAGEAGKRSEAAHQAISRLCDGGPWIWRNSPAWPRTTLAAMDGPTGQHHLSLPRHCQESQLLVPGGHRLAPVGQTRERRASEAMQRPGPTGQHHLRPAASLPGKPVAGPRWAPACAGVTNKGAASERSDATPWTDRPAPPEACRVTTREASCWSPVGNGLRRCDK